MKNRYVLLLDLPLVAAATICAFVLRFGWTFATTRPEYPFVLVAGLLAKPVIFRLFGLYNRYWRYASVFDLLLIAVAVTTSSLVMGAIVAAGVTAGVIEQFSRAVWVIDWLLTFLAVAGLRLSIRLVAEAAPRRAGLAALRRVLVVGAGEAGMLIVREMRKNTHLGLEPVGYVDDDVSKHGKRILGLPVAGSLG